jgi:hypothetical protein
VRTQTSLVIAFLAVGGTFAVVAGVARTEGAPASDGTPAKAAVEPDPWVGEFKVYESGHLADGKRVYWLSARYSGKVTITKKGETYRISACDGVDLRRVKNRLEPVEEGKHPKWVEFGEKDDAGRPTLLVMFSFNQIFLVRDKPPATWTVIAGEGRAGRPPKPPGAALSNWKVARVYELDGAGDHVRVDDSPELRPATLTLAAWVNSSDVRFQQPIVAKALAKGNWCSYMLRVQPGGKLSLAVENTAADGSAHWQTKSALKSKKWCHVAATWANTNGDAKDAKIYFDGVEQEIEQTRAVGYGPRFRIGYTAEPLYIGRDEYPSGHFMGTIKDVQIIDRALTAAEIKRIVDK